MNDANVGAFCVGSLAMNHSELTSADYERARRLLIRRDPVLGTAIKRIGPCGLAARQRKDHLTALIGAVVSQQLSTKAAATIFRRFAGLFPEGEPLNAVAIDRVSDDVLRSVGLSGQKVGYLRDLCGRIVDGRLQLQELDGLPDDAVVERLTAEMFLMFRLHRPDVLPVADLGIVRAVQKLYKLRKRPTAERIFAMGEAWRPYRSVASWYLWQTLHAEPMSQRKPQSISTRGRTKKVAAT